MHTSKNTILNIITYFIVMVLAGSTVYFYLKSHEAPTNIHSNPNNKATITKTEQSIIPTAKPSTSLTPTITQPSKSTNKPSNPAQTYTVGGGETLFGIATKLNMNWTRLTEVNNLPNGDSIKEGQVLFVPSYDETTKKLYLEFTPDITKATQIQNQAANLPTSPYLDPSATAKQDSIGFYGLTTDAAYSFISKNELEGSAIVNVTLADKSYQIILIQPINKGKDGIWAISKIIPN